MSTSPTNTHRTNPSPGTGSAATRTQETPMTQQPAPAERLPQLAVPCPACQSPAGQLCTSHDGTRVRRHNTHQARTRAWTVHTRETS